MKAFFILMLLIVPAMGQQIIFNIPYYPSHFAQMCPNACDEKTGLCTLAGCISADKFAQMVTPQMLRTQRGEASTYGYNKGSGDGSNQKLACGGRLNVKALTAAHNRLPCGTKVTVTNTNNGKSVVVTINDHFPGTRGRVIDLSPAAANAIGMGYGVAPVILQW